MSQRKRSICKLFRLIDFKYYDEFLEGQGDDEPKRKGYQKEFHIQMFGINENGETCSIIVKDYKPFFYVKVSDDFDYSKLVSFERSLNNVKAKIDMVKHKKLYGFSGGKKFKFLKLEFESSSEFSRAKYLISDKIKKKEFKNMELYESNIPPLLRYFHINEVSPSGWISINTSKVLICTEKTTTCTFEYECLQKYVKPLPEKETRVPYKICSFDIEASSSHGDFPLPVKSYKRLATNIFDLHKTYSPTSNKSGQLIKNIILTAFGYSNFENVDLVYPIDAPESKQEVNDKIEIFLKKSLKEASSSQNVSSVMTVIKMFQQNDDDEEEYESPSKKSKKINDKVTVLDILQNDDYSRDQKIQFIDTALTSVFPKLEGDKVTFIGSTFMNYGESEPNLNHCLVVGTCDDIEGVTVETCKNEEELLLKWVDLIQHENPDIIIGYNIFGFDYEFMFRRAQENRIGNELLMLSRNNGELCGKIEDGELEIENTKILLASGEYDLKYYKIPGRLQIDMYTYFRKDFNLSSYKLDDVAAEFISDDIIKTKIVKNKTELYSKNLVGLNPGDFIHIEICGFTTDYFENGKKFKVVAIEERNEDNDSYNVIIIDGKYELQNKKLKWTMAKDDVTPQDIFRLTNGTSADRAVVAKYCIQDCNLVHHLMRKIDVITGYVEMSSICSVPISFLVFRGQGIKLTSYVAKKCREKDTLMPDLIKSSTDNSGYEGAIVLPPKCSMYMDNPVACVDYSSLYPSSMISQNYSHDSKVWTKEYNLQGDLLKTTGEKDENGNFIYDNLPEYQYIDIEFDTYAYLPKSEKTPWVREKVKTGKKLCRWAQLPDNQKSIMPAILEDLLKARKATKKLMKNEKDPFMENILDKRQLGYKVTANSLYGQCGAKTSTFYEQDVAASTTATGRMMITYAKKMIEEIYGDMIYETKESGKVRTRAEYIYGDTDSVFFTFNLEDPETGEKILGKKALELTIEIAQDVADLCTSFLKPPMGLEYEKTLMPFILLSKKRYVGMLYEFNPNKGKLKFMGLSLKRRDSCDYLKDTYGGILNILMGGSNIEKAVEFLNDSLNELVEGKVPMDKLAITKALRSDYKNPNQIAHKVLANRIGERDPGNKPKPGDRMKFVFIDNSNPKALLGDRVETPEFINENKLKIDYTYYITNQLMKPLQQLFGLALVQIWESRRKTGAIKEYKKEINKIEKDCLDDYENFMKKKEKYCSTQVKKLLFDKILTKISNEKNKLQLITTYF